MKHTISLTSIGDNFYKTIQIGNQVWMAENLKVTRYRNGDKISTGHSASEWKKLTSGAYCIYNNNASGEVDTYGALYNWYAVTDSRNIAPEGWHVPTDDEWKELEMALGMSRSEVDDSLYRGTNEGSKLAGNAGLWESGMLESNSEFGNSGFTALPGGYRYNFNGYFLGMGGYGYFWSATENYSSIAWVRFLNFVSSGIYRSSLSKSYGFSVRLLRDYSI